MPEAQDDQVVMICEPRAVQAEFYDVIATYNNVAVAKHALLHDNPRLALHKLEHALSWCASVLGVAHPFAGDKTAADQLLQISIEGKSEAVRLS